MQSEIPESSGPYWVIHKFVPGAEWEVGLLSYGWWDIGKGRTPKLFLFGVREGQDPNSYDFGDKVKRPALYAQ